MCLSGVYACLGVCMGVCVYVSKGVHTHMFDSLSMLCCVVLCCVVLCCVVFIRIDESEGLESKKPYKVPASNSSFDQEAKVWKATNLPKAIPDKREDVGYLEEWLTEK